MKTKILNVNPELDNIGFLWYVEYLVTEDELVHKVQECFTDKTMAELRLKSLQRKVGK